jgi:carboxylate-amine ligase
MIATTEPCSDGGTQREIGGTVGVEQEFVLTDQAGLPAPAASTVIGSTVDADPHAATAALQTELAACQVELATPICGDAVGVLAQLRRLRAQLADAAHDQGLLLLASGTPPLTGTAAALSQDQRYRQIAGHYRGLTDTAHVSGCHIHVGVPDRAAAVRASNHLRAWLPVLLAASANSPFAAGVDTGYASWRHQLMIQWPASGPPPHFESVDHHDSVLAALTQAGGVLDPAAVYWAVRLSPRYPTIEVRVCDVTPTAWEAALLAALVRALTITAVSDTGVDATAGVVPDEVLRADLWRAARDGLGGSCAAPAGERPVPAGLALRRLVEHVRPGLRACGDEEFVEFLLRRLLHVGDGATRQRAAYRRRGALVDVVGALAVPAGQPTDLMSPQWTNGTEPMDRPV